MGSAVGFGATDNRISATTLLELATGVSNVDASLFGFWAPNLNGCFGPASLLPHEATIIARELAFTDNAIEFDLDINKNVVPLIIVYSMSQYLHHLDIH